MTTQGSKESQDELRKILDQAEWAWIKPHALRDAVILVSQKQDLLMVGEAIATDATQLVEDWIRQGDLTKPTVEQMAAWDQEEGRKFLCLVVQPYVLIQDQSA